MGLGRLDNAAAPAWNASLADAFVTLRAGPEGLGSDEAQRRLQLYGANDVTAVKRRPLWLRFVERFANPLVLILIFASTLAASTGDPTGFVIIMILVALSVTLDFVQEMRAEQAVDALRRTIAVKATVLRDGRQTLTLVEAVVPGDVVTLAAGDLAPADCRLIESRDLFVDQALLTGEPYPVEKHAEAALNGARDPLAGHSALFMGSSVVSGTAKALVCATGRATQFGQIARKVVEKPQHTEFESGVRGFGFLILRLTILLVLFVLAVNAFFHRPFLESLMFALALAVGLTPELLPMILTVTLARGAVRLSRNRVIVKRLSAVHNVGAIDVLCTDKTGTLTEARIALVRTEDAAGTHSAAVFELAYLNSFFETGIKSPLDAAVLEHRALDVGVWRKLDEVPFDFERRRVSILLTRDEEHLLVVKGAPEDVLRVSSSWEPEAGRAVPLEKSDRARWLERCRLLSAEGYRVLGIARRSLSPERTRITRAHETELVFAGLAVFLDPPKATAASAIRALTEAGIDIKILTGDGEEVTRHVCAAIGVPVTGVVSGSELQAMSPDALLGRLSGANVFCRVTPQQKHRILLALQRRGHVVGFMGDGINDAAALHAADVGISVDSAADVAKGSADLVLLEHDLNVLHQAVMEGRRAVVNVTKYVLMGTSSNFGNMFSMAGASLILPFLPMRPIQILLNNLLYDGSEAALPFDAVDPEELAKPVRWDLSLIRRFMLVIGPISSIFDFLTFFVLLKVLDLGEAAFQTGWFIESLATQVMVVFVIRTRRRFYSSLPDPRLAAAALGLVVIGIALPLSPVGYWFGFEPLPAGFYAFLGIATATYLLIVEAVKRRFYARLHRFQENSGQR